MNIAVWLQSPASACWTITSQQIEYMQSRIPSARILHAKTPEEFVEILPKAETAVCWFFEQEWVTAAEQLRYLVTPAAGLDYFAAQLPPHIRVKNSRFHGRIISESVIGMLLDHNRRITESATLMRSEEWPRGAIADRARRLQGSHLVILGFGNIGEWVARRATLFGCRITGIKRNPEIPRPEFFTRDDRVEPLEQLNTILPSADHLVLSLPRNLDTDHIIGRDELGRLPAHAAIYNIGRGNAIDHASLADALRSHQLEAAYLDVFEQEPLPMSSPLRRISNCFLMPHISAAAPDFLDMFIDEFSARYRKWHTE